MIMKIAPTKLVILLLYTLFLCAECLVEENLRTVEVVPMSILGYKLKGFKYKVLHSISSLTCSQRCLSEFPQCLSYNHLSTMGESICELNSKGISSMAEGLAGKLDKEPSSVFVQLQSASMYYPRTCADHYKSGSRVSGIYYIRYESHYDYRVYCDMKSEVNKVYTLVMSQSFANRAKFTSLPLYQDTPLKEDEPNWEYYRLSLARMKHISTRSSHWRVTCNFPSEGLKYVDYVRGTVSDLDFLTFNEEASCKKVEYINVVKHSCTDCTAGFWQKGQMLHYDMNSDICQFGLTPGYSDSQDAFGLYLSFTNNFRCCSSESSTTNHWLGTQV